MIRIPSLALPLFLLAASSAIATGVTVEPIAESDSWVSPYWGYSTPKIVFDGNSWFAVGMRGNAPDQSAGFVCQRDTNGNWKEIAALPDIYQPPTICLDSERRLIVAHTRSGKPVRILRASHASQPNSLGDLPTPTSMENAYYIGITCFRDTLYLAYITSPDYGMYLTALDLASLQWRTAVQLQKGQLETKPKTAWVYPILAGNDKGLHVVASNSPDGGEENTYNEIWYLLLQPDTLAPVIREKVQSSPMGHVTYAMDMQVDPAGDVHILYQGNRRLYGPPKDPEAQPSGVFHAWRKTATACWSQSRVGPEGMAALSIRGKDVEVFLSGNGAIGRYQWENGSTRWSLRENSWAQGTLPGAPGFMDMVSPNSGSVSGRTAAVVDVCDPEKPMTHRLFFLLADTP